MTVTPGFSELVNDLLSPLGTISVRRMFSGGGVYCDGVMFGLIMDDILFLKTDAATRAPYADEGCGPFAYEGKGRIVETSYWRMPERLLDDADEMIAWARIALGVARKGAAAKARRPARSTVRRRTSD